MAKLNLENGQVKIFKNTLKEANTKQPDYNGGLMIDDTDYNIALWVNESKSGMKYFSGKVQKPQKPSDPDLVDEDSNDLPF